MSLVKGVVDYVTQKLCADITKIAEDNLRYVEEELSARLAVAGILPMFGFPTQSRTLFHLNGRPPSNYRKIDDIVLTDRSLEFAIWSFSLRQKS